MKNALLVGLLAGGFSGGTGAMIVVALRDSAPRRAVSAVQPITADTSDLEARIAELDRLNRDLVFRLEALENRPVMTADGRESVSRIDDDLELEKDLMELLGAFQDPGQELPERMVEGVRTALGEIRAQEEEERDRRREEAQAERMEERLVELADELGLNPYQVGEMRVVFDDMTVKRNGLFASMREGGDWVGVRDRMRELRDESDTALEGFLTPDQFGRYKDLQRGPPRGESDNSDRNGRDRDRERRNRDRGR